MTSATIFTEFARSAATAGRRAALKTLGRTLTYAEVHALVLARAGELAGLNEGPVAILCEEPVPLIAAFLACAALGRPAMILDPALPEERLRAQLKRYQPVVLAAEAKFAALVGTRPLIELRQPPVAPPASPGVVSTHAEFYWGVTSGTTGEPKLFARSHRSWLESFRAAEACFPFPQGSRILIPGPLSHYLFLYGAVHALCRGHSIILPGPFRPNRAVSAARSASNAYLVPPMLADMLKWGLAGADPSVIFCGGAKLPQELRMQAEARLSQLNLVEFYGASETSFIAWHSTRSPAPEGSVGRLFPGVAVEVRGPDGGRLPPEAEGELFVKSPMLFSRYVGGPNAADWFAPGDLGVYEGGFLYLTGRKSRIIHSRALKIRPEPIEEALLELPGVRRAAVVELPDSVRGAIAIAAIETETGIPPARRTLSAHCRERLGARFSPYRYYHAETLPLTRSGKVALSELREAILAGHRGYRELR